MNIQLSQQDLENNNINNNDKFICGVIEGFYGEPWSFEQRKNLFEVMKKLNLNAFLYAPKDDTKHRANWRQLYSKEEADQLASLIKEAQNNDVDFYYSLAPGLDMIYSKQEELDLLIKKYDQLVGLGCRSFAILFDDIEPNLADEDKGVFENYAAAQVAVSNMIYEHLRRPKFLFCPTEYCESRAVPNVLESQYLNTIGRDLESNIDFLWSGSRVISRLITEESMETLASVIRRPAIIWENLHANDYDKKRVFLGPYSGRSTRIKSKIKGIMTNPNCEYEANYIAIHTLAQWCSCSEDINRHNMCNLEQDKETPLEQFNLNDKIDDNVIIEQYNTINSSMTSIATITTAGVDESSGERIYNPEKALVNAIRDWLPHLLKHKSLPSNEIVQVIERDDKSAANQLNKDQDDSENIIDAEDNNIEMFPEESQLSVVSVSTNKSEMDTSSSPIPNDEIIRNNNLIVDSNTCDSCDMPDINDSTNSQPAFNQHDASSSSSSGQEDDSMMCFSNINFKPLSNIDAINQQNLALIIDLFYLPFEHGLHGRNFLKEIDWLKQNSHTIFLKSSIQCVQQTDDDKQEVQMRDADERDEAEEMKRSEEWKDRAQKLNDFCSYVNKLVNNLISVCPNKLLIKELYPYLTDVRDLTTLVMDYVRFLRHRASLDDSFYYTTNLKSKESQVLDDQEPWCHRGGLIGDVQRLIST